MRRLFDRLLISESSSLSATLERRLPTPRPLMPVTIRLVLEREAPQFIRIRVTSGMMTAHADHLPFLKNGMTGLFIFLLTSVGHSVNVHHTSMAASVALSPNFALNATARQHHPMDDRIHSIGTAISTLMTPWPSDSDSSSNHRANHRSDSPASVRSLRRHFYATDGPNLLDDVPRHRRRETRRRDQWT